MFLCLKIICGFEISAAHQCQGCVNRSNVRADMMGSHSHLYVLHCDCVVFSVYLSSSYFCSVMYDSLEGTLSQHFPGHHHKSKKKKKKNKCSLKKASGKNRGEHWMCEQKDWTMKALVPEMAFALWFANIGVALWVWHTPLVLLSVNHLSVGQHLLS